MVKSKVGLMKGGDIEFRPWNIFWAAQINLPWGLQNQEFFASSLIRRFFFFNSLADSVASFRELGVYVSFNHFIFLAFL